MKLNYTAVAFSALRLSVPSTSGLRDETNLARRGVVVNVYGFQYPQPRVYAMKLRYPYRRTGRLMHLSVPSTSGLRDETSERCRRSPMP